MRNMISVIFDLDGVLYRGKDNIPGALECVAKLRELGVKVGFLTNNAGRTRADRVEKLRSHGIIASENEIMTSGVATAQYLIDTGHAGKRIYTVGTDGLYKTFIEFGFDADDNDEGDPVDFVVVCWDKNFSYKKITRAQREILVNKAKFIATNVDAMFPTDNGGVLPGAGSMVAAVATASATQPLVIGKPSTFALDYLLKSLGISEGELLRNCWVVGDRLDTDIKCGNDYGARTVLVTTGINSRNEGEKAPKGQEPDYILDSLLELIPLIEEEISEK